MDTGARRLMETLRTRFGLPVYYSRSDYDSGSLGVAE